MPDWPPLRGASFQIITPLYDGSGSLVAAGGGLAACVSKDAGAFAAATCTVTEINTNAGLYAMKLSDSEMDADVVAYKIVSTSASARRAASKRRPWLRLLSQPASSPAAPSTMPPST